MRKVLTLCRVTYCEWLLRQQTLVLIPVVILIDIVIIDPMRYYAGIMQTPLNLLEPYLCMLNSILAVPLLPCLFLFLIAGFPKLNAGTMLQIYRTGKVSWLFSQILFLAAAALTILAVMIVTSCLPIAADAFLANGWSTAVRKIYSPDYSDLFFRSGLAVIDRSVTNQIRPYQATVLCTVLQLCYMVIAGLFDLCFTLIGRKLTGILMNVLLTGAGLFLIVTDTGIKWMFPSAHAVFAWHYDQMLNQTNCSVSVSIIYDLVLTVLLLALSVRTVRRCSLYAAKTE